MSELPVLSIRHLDLRFAPRPWPFAVERRSEIDGHFATLHRANPALWNGRVLMLHGFAVDGDRFEGSYLETDFASFLAWRDWGYPDATMRNCFSMAAVRSSDGAFLLGVMGGHTANAGKVYFPAGTPEPSDIRDGRIDLAGSARRELREETGLDADTLDAEDGWVTVLTPQRVAMMKVMRARESAVALRERMRAFLATEEQPELADVRIVRGAADLTSEMPDHVVAFLSHMWRRPG